MNTEKMRAAFEAAYMKDVSDRFSGVEVGDEEWLSRGSNGDYRSYRAAGAWWAWQVAWNASREDILVDLPEEFDGVKQGAMSAIMVRQSIESAGIKVKP